MVRPLACLFLFACTASDELRLPDDPATSDMPVGVQTLTVGSVTLEVWYPAVDRSTEDAADIELSAYVPEAFAARVPDLPTPSWTSRALRDAEPRDVGDSLPLVLFSHGFGGFRTQSTDLTSHLAARGYVVVSADHPGRMITDVLPCLLSPPADSCDLFASVTDPGPEGLAAALSWATESDHSVAALVDSNAIGVFGHSAGGGSATTFASEEERVGALLAMAGAGTLTRDLPSVVFGGSCDGVVPESSLLDAGPSFRDGYWSLEDAGHLAFSDLCQVDLGAIADQLATRDDANGLFLAQLRALGTDGCPNATPTVDSCTTFMAPEVYEPLTRAFVTRFFDGVFRGGPGVDATSSDGIAKTP